jgi:predicted Zn finger-like uncharacterized protein
MKISCPECNASGNIPEHEIPEAGRFVSCPRCKHGFTVNKPRSSGDAYLVGTCPACHYSTFGDETFGSCPKCGVVVKTFVERQREDQLQQRNKELLEKKFSRDNVPPPPETPAAPVADFIDSLHPVNLIGWGVAVVAVIVTALGLWGVMEYDSTAIHTRLLEQREEPVSGLYIFIRYGLADWLQIIYGLAAAVVSVVFIKRLRSALKAMSTLLWAAIAYVPVSYIISFIIWVQAPIPHTIGGYLIELFNIVFMSALVGAPLFILERYLHERAITSVVRL